MSRNDRPVPRKVKLRINRTACISVSILCILMLATLPILTRAQNPQTSAPAAAEDYKIGPGDVLSITVSDAPEFSGKFRVSDSGMIEITSVSDPVQAQNMSPIALAHAIEKALRDARQLRDPKVHVFIEEYHGRTITVLGAVSKPSVYSLARRTTVLDALSMAGGALPNSGNTVTIVRGDASAEASDAPVGSVKIIDVSRLTRGEDMTANVEVRNGDVLNVSPAQVVYVVGAVTKPGGYVLANPADGVSVVQAVALAEGFRPLAATHRGLIIRQSTSEQGRREIAVDVQNIMNGKETDLVLAPDDILYIPESNGKKAVKIMTDIAMATVNGIAIYGIGYRIGNAHF